MKLTEYKLKREFKPKSQNQEKYYRAICENDFIVCTGVAGSGKTAVAVGYAITHVIEGLTSKDNRSYKKMVITRPTVSADEESKDDIGFLPGSMNKKMDPYMRPVYDEINTYFDYNSGNPIGRMLDQNIIEIAPLCYMRGRTFHNAVVICDEAQNCTWNQLKLICSRIGKNSKLIITGDTRQCDRKGGRSPLDEWIRSIFPNIKGIALCELDRRDIVRHPLVGAIMKEVESQEMFKEANK